MAEGDGFVQSQEEGAQGSPHCPLQFPEGRLQPGGAMPTVTALEEAGLSWNRADSG